MSHIKLLSLGATDGPAPAWELPPKHGRKEARGHCDKRLHSAELQRLPRGRSIWHLQAVSPRFAQPLHPS